MTEFAVSRFPVQYPSGALAWPDRHDAEWIAKQRESTTPQRFAQAYLLEPTKADFDEFARAWATEQGWAFPDLHRRMCVQMQVEPNLFRDRQAPLRRVEAYRGSGKTYLLCLYAAWRLYLDPQWTMVLVAQTERVAMELLHVVKRVLEEHPLTKGMAVRVDKNHLNVDRPVVDLRPSLNAVSLNGKFTVLTAHECLIDCDTSDEVMAEIRSMTDRVLQVCTPGFRVQSEPC